MTQANIGLTICVSGYTTTIRPPSSYTDALKVQQMSAYGFAGSTSNYEEDHLIALEIGGDPRDAQNLWPEPRTSIGGAAEQKDKLENKLHAQVCAGTMTLAAAQECVAVDWVACQNGSVPTATPTTAPTTAPTSAPPAPTTTASPTAAATTAPPTSSAPPASFSVTITNSVWGALSASTSPGATCTASARYANGNLSVAQGITATHVADAYGTVSWSYTQASTTTQGIGTHTVTCTVNGATKTASAPFTVP